VLLYENCLAIKTRSGASFKQQHREESSTERGSHIAMIIVFTTPANGRDRTVTEMIQQLRKDAKHITRAEIKFEKPSPGPPVGKPIAVRIKGNDFKTLAMVANQFKEWLATIKGVKDIDDDYSVGKNELRIIVDEKAAAKAFLSYTTIARAVNAAFAGGIATTIKTTSDEIDVRIIFSDEDRHDINAFNEILIQKNQVHHLFAFQEHQKYFFLYIE
ncbi:efflux RND transporter permease subunit, partial [Candidatus Omnitrophota bacterium]